MASTTSNVIKLANKELISFGNKKPRSLGDSLKSLSYKRKYNDTQNPQTWAVSETKDVVGKSGLAGSLLLAYSYHRALVLSPDDFWLHITQQVSKHIVTNSEAYRSNFVDHEEKQEINVFIDEAVATYGLHDFRTWQAGVEQITNKLTNLVKADTADIFVKKFSTTTQVNLTANQIVLMDAMKNYFSYKMSTMCGIPEVEMKGTRDDWEQLIKNTKTLHALVDIDGPIGNVVSSWFKNLYPVLDNLLETYDYNSRGVVDKLFSSVGTKLNVQEWWSHIADEKTTHGSGGATRYYGWITRLFLYNSAGTIFTHKDNEIDDFPSGVCICPFIFDDNGKQYKLNLVAGHCGSEIRESDGAVIPSIGWTVVDQVKESPVSQNPWDF